MHIAAKEGSLNVMKYLVEELNAEINDCTTSAPQHALDETNAAADYSTILTTLKL